jgi:protein phosphatase
LDLLVPETSLVILIGPAGAGKTTFATHYFKKAQVVSSAKCRELVCDDRYARDAEKQANYLLRRIVGARLSLGKLTVADATNIRPFPRKKLLRLARTYGAPTVGILFGVGLAACLKRNALREHHEPEPIIERQWREFEAVRNELSRESFHVLYELGEMDRPRVRLTPTCA